MLLGIGHLLNKHKDATVWICGTGPSLDNIEDAEITGPRIYLNRAAFALPAEEGQTYWLVADDAWGKKIPGPWAATRDAILRRRSPLYGVFRQPLFGADNAKINAPTGHNVYLWHGNKQDALLNMPREDIARSNTLHQFAGTGAPAVHLAWLMGARKVILAGLDGTDGYAKRLAEFYDKPALGGFGYAAARIDTEDVISALKLEYEDRSQ